MTNTATAPASEQPTTSPAEPTWRFNSTDRCDTCRAQAYVGAVVNGTELLFCAHHYRKAEAKLALVSSKIHDERERLQENRAKGQP